MASDVDRRAEVRDAARRLLGFETLRPGQEEATAAVVAGHDVLAVMPTGSGKSAVYQLAGALRPGLSVVVSPLLALQRDQVQSLEDLEVGPARALNSDLSAAEADAVLAEVAAGGVKYLFVAPEQLQRPAVALALVGAELAMVAVDEAHCVCNWGHDFRPDYRRIGTAVELWGHPPVAALTATAAPPVRDGIVAGLGLRQPVVVAAGYDRPNIFLAVEHHAEAAAKDRALLDALAAAPGAGIVYAATRRRCQELADAAEGVRAAAYHAGLPAARRREVEAGFMAGHVDVVVATTAFGMGIDKPDVRFVFHADVAESLDAYYQEIGRAGRDGAPAEARLFYRPEDLGLRRFFASGRPPDPADALIVLHALRQADGPLERGELRRASGLSPGRLRTVLGALERAGVAESLPGGAVLPLPARLTPEQAWRRVEREAQVHQAMDESRVEMVRSYAEGRGCRRRALLGYFGELAPERCGRCDTCRSGLVATAAAPSRRFPVGARVVHDRWGHGDVLRRDGDAMVVLFPAAGYRTLSEQLVVDRRLLREAPAS